MIDLLLRMFVKSLLWLRYRINVTGAERVAARGKKGILFLPNHPALIDPIILMITLRRLFRPRALADSDQVDRFFIRSLARHVGVLEIPDLAKRGADSKEQAQQAVGKCVDALRAGDNLVLYPAGHVYHSRLENLRGNSAVETILKELPDVRVVLVRTRGLWGSSFSWAGGSEPSVGRCLKKGLGYLLLNGLFFSPRRKVSIELHEPDDLPRSADRETLNRYIEDYYNADAPPSTYVPYTVWQRGGVRTMPEPETGLRAGDAGSVPQTTRRLVTEYLSEATGRAAAKIADDEHLARDLGLDSLARADMLVWLEKEFGFGQGDVDALQTVADVMLAACGEAIISRVANLKAVSPKWSAAVPRRRAVPAPGKTVAEVFLNQALAAPARAAVADQASGVKTYRDVLTGIFALKDRITALQGERVGIMLPASVAADTAYMAALFAGKTPVMVNWTVGRRNMIHAMDLADVRAVITAKALVSRLEVQGVDFSGLTGRMVFLEEMAASLSWREKVAALLKARFRPGSLRTAAIAPTAVILFTSGSESLPKAVPLTHENLLTNIRDACVAIHLRTDDRMLGILPPFHSFGLTVGMLLPMCIGASVVHHPNPTEAAMLARVVEAYGATLLIGTPTFLAGMVRASAGCDLTSLRMAVTGGEKCPDRVYQALAERCGEAAILEGYGVTECSPVISVNREDSIGRGTIGKVLDSVEYAIVDVDTDERVALGGVGMLLVRGPSVFGGYLNYDGPDPFSEFEGCQWYRTGDLVSADADGVLTFRGRLKRFVKLGGEMISLPAVEAVLLEHYASDDDEGPVIAVEATASEDHPELVLFTTVEADRATVNEQIRQAGLSALHNVRRVIRVDEIPVLGTGKTNYRVLKERLDTL